MTGKALRRMRQSLAKSRSLRRLKNLFSSHPEWFNPRVIGIHAKTPRRCSCGLCGNPRRFLGLRTRQELIAMLADG